MIFTSLREALLAARISEESAFKAADEVSAFGSRLDSIRTDLFVLKWMLAAILVGMVVLFIQSPF